MDRFRDVPKISIELHLRRIHSEPFSANWWTWITAAAFFMGAAFWFVLANYRATPGKWNDCAGTAGGCNNPTAVELPNSPNPQIQVNPTLSPV